MSSDLLTRKLRLGFDSLDADGSGSLAERDYEAMARRVSDAIGHPAGSPAEQRIRERYLDIWHQALAPMVPEGDTAVPRDVFVDSVRDLVANDLPTAEGLLRGIVGVYLEIADLDADGQLTFDEFSTFQHANFPSLTDADVEVAFSRLDTDSDGVLSGEEFLQAIVDHLSSTDPDAPGNWWLGPVPD